MKRLAHHRGTRSRSVDAMRVELERLARAHEAMEIVGDYLERGDLEAKAMLARAVLAAWLAARLAGS